MIERTEVDQMAKFMAALTPSQRTPQSSTPTETPTLSADVAEMKAILERFHAAAENVVADAPFDRVLREALATEATPQGARIGAWEIRVNQSGPSRRYDVVSALNGQPLASDLLLYEAAQGLARILNAGGRINSPAAIELLRAEQEYNSRVGDMILYKHRLAKQPNSPRVTVFEARYSDARRRAVAARARVGKLAQTGLI